MPDAQFYFSSCQMFDFLIFTDTRRSILSLLIFIYFTTLQNFVYKEQVR